jgi:RNA polymerase sigma factor (TIGR02999 family)
VTELLAAWRAGDRSALDRLIPQVYGELRRLADRALGGERAGHTLQPTALVHEAYLKLAGAAAPRWNDRLHFFAVAAQLMRRILVDHARVRKAAKRGGGLRFVPLDEESDALDERTAERAAELVALDDALSSLSALDPRKARILELQYFGGLSLAETAEVLALSTSTIGLEARLARAWLLVEMARGGRGEAP